ncbi:piggyBac transposable element-derived protein 3-like [Macrobrachium rosenbergii]|uniref:piggyBac transposable element-derived protein 3-like n=1 Tax=Macrobrachium rosenbergii TaxID=79674 RepID=UPI0034D3C46A
MEYLRNALVSVDEMMVKYYGHNSLKQFIQVKPTRFGYKLWARCGTSGYCYNFDLYCGKNPQLDKNDEIALGSKVVLKMLEAVADPESHAVYFYNYFTGYELLVHLRNIGFQASGTHRENCLKNCTLKSTNDMRKETRGSYDYRFDTNEEVLMVNWLDNKCVTVGTNYDTVEPLAKVQRWIKTSKSKGSVPQPNAIFDYNKCMGGVDHHDWLVGKYSVSIRGKKWYWPLFIRMRDMAVVNSWIIYKLLHQGHGFTHLSLLDFKRAISVAYLKLACMEGSVGRPCGTLHSRTNFVDVRYDGKDNFIEKRNNQQRYIYDHIVKETVRYATASRNKLDFVFSVDELKSLIGILLLSNFHKLPSERHYWSKDEDLGVSIVKKSNVSE